MCIDIDNQLYTYKFKSTHIYCTYLKITMISQCSIDWKLKFWDEILIFPMIENALKLCFLHWNLPLRIYALEQTKETFNENQWWKLVITMWCTLQETSQALQLVFIEWSFSSVDYTVVKIPSLITLDTSSRVLIFIFQKIR